MPPLTRGAAWNRVAGAGGGLAVDSRWILWVGLLDPKAICRFGEADAVRKSQGMPERDYSL